VGVDQKERDADERGRARKKDFGRRNVKIKEGCGQNRTSMDEDDLNLKEKGHRRKECEKKGTRTRADEKKGWEECWSGKLNKDKVEDGGIDARKT
jgi:hypothetical protein